MIDQIEIDKEIYIEVKKAIDNLYDQEHTFNWGVPRQKMPKTGNSKKRKDSSESRIVTHHAPLFNANLKNSKQVSDTLLECIRTGDLNSFREVLASYIMSTNKLRLSKKSGIGRRTLYDILDPRINFNPALSTVSAIIRGLSE